MCVREDKQHRSRTLSERKRQRDREREERERRERQGDRETERQRQRERACHIGNMNWGGNHYFKGTIITKLKEIFNFGPQEMEALTYIGTGLEQNSDFCVKIDQNSYVDSI